MMFRMFIVFSICTVLPSVVLASSQGPSIQERRAMQEAQAMQQKKQQEVAIFKKQRDELMLNYKSMAQVKNQLEGQMKISQRDYKGAMAKFNQAQEQEGQIESQIVQLRKNSSKVDTGVVEGQMKKLRDTQAQIIENMKNFSNVQKDSYESLQAFDMQYRNLLAKEQVLRQQIEAVQRQLQFVISQP